MINYKQAIEYIYDLNKYGVKLGLKNITYLLSLFDNPHLKTNVIHIAGTNGKGSTAAFISSILKSANYKVGLYTSPHLVSFQERIRINEKYILQEEICHLLERMIPAVKKVESTEGYQHPTFFEVITAMAFIYFYENKVDFAVMEVGLGGRLDATNVSQPVVSVISHIDYDHMDRLGNTLSEIAREKGAIIKNNTPIISAQQYEEPDKVIETISRKKNAQLYKVGRDIKAIINNTDWKGNTFNYSGIKKDINNINIPLIGDYQVENASLAIGVAEVLAMKGCPIDNYHIINGLEETRWPGRFDIVNENPIIILDGGHNPNGVKQFILNLKKLLKSNKRIIAILGIFSDKNYRGIIENVVPYVDYVILTMANNPRATPLPILAREVWQYIDPDKTAQMTTVDSAIKYSLKISRENDIICLTGSLYTVGEAEAYFLKEKKNKKIVE